MLKSKIQFLATYEEEGQNWNETAPVDAFPRST